MSVNTEQTNFSRHHRETWPDAKVEQLKKLWADGINGTLIGRKLGYTRSAVMGKITRLGLHNRRERRPATAASDAKPRKQAPTRFFRPKATPIATAKPAPLPAPPPVNGGLSIFELRDDQCKYIVAGEGHDAKFCGHPIDLAVKKLKSPQAASYCRAHASLCYINYCPTQVTE